MNLTRRNVTIALFILQIAGLGVFLTISLFSPMQTFMLATVVFSLVVICVLLFAYVRGWEYARHISVVMATLIAGFGVTEPFLNTQFATAIFIPPTMALILVGPSWVIASAGSIYVLLLARAGFIGVYAEPQTFVIYAMIIGGIVLARLIADVSQHAAEENARQAETQRARAEVQSRELAEANELMNTQLDQQRQLLELVTTLETPVVPLAEGVLYAPIVGHVDSRRAQMLTNRLLQEAHTQRARMVVLDVSGVAMIDTAVARALMNAVQSLRLLGCEVTISGISASVAMTMMHLGIGFDGIVTARSPQEALTDYLHRQLTPVSTGNGSSHSAS